jgi:hypothetical protein
MPKLARIDLIHRSDAVAAVTGLAIDKVVLLPDGARKPVYVSPGAHEIVVQHGNGVTVVSRTSQLAAGAAERVEMEDPAPEQASPLGPDASAPVVVREEIRVNKGKRVAPYASGGAGVALAAAAAVLGVEAFNNKSDLQTKCDGDLCSDPAAATSERSTGKTFATLSTVGFAAGGAALAAAVYLFVSSRETAHAGDSAWLEPATDGHGAGVQLGYRF